MQESVAASAFGSSVPIRLERADEALKFDRIPSGACSAFEEKSCRQVSPKAQCRLEHLMVAGTAGSKPFEFAMIGSSHFLVMMPWAALARTRDACRSRGFDNRSGIAQC